MRQCADGFTLSPDKQDYRAKLAAYQERKGKAWARWVASQQTRPQATASINRGPTGEDNADIRKQTAAQDEVIKQLINDLGKAYQIARTTKEISRAVAIFEAETAAIRDRAGQHGDDRAAGISPPTDDGHDKGNPRAGGPGRRDVGGYHESKDGGGAEQDRRDSDSPDGSRGEPATSGGVVRARFADATAAVRIESRLDAQPDAMARLRAATQALQPDPFGRLEGRAWFEAVSGARADLYARYIEQRTATVKTLKGAPKPATFDGWVNNQARTDPVARAVASAVAEQNERRAPAAARLADDRARIERILSTHPHPDPDERDPEARERREERAARDEHTASRTADAAASAAEAKAAFQDRGPLTWLRNVVFGRPTIQQQQALDAAEYAERNANTRPVDGALKVARERGRLLAIGARDRTQAWDAKPDVVVALEQDRLNSIVDEAANVGNQTILRALRQGDPDAARAVILAREEAERSKQEEMERRQGMQRGPGRPKPGTGGPPGPRGPR